MSKGLYYKALVVLVLCLLSSVISKYSFGGVDNFPAYFMKNEGQFQNGSKYCLKSAASNTFFFDNYLVHQFISESKHQDSISNEVLNLRVDFKNCNLHPVFEERDVAKSKSNFFIGNDPSGWKSDIATFNTLVYNDLYRSIDLIYYNLSQGVKSDFIIKPNGDPSDITLKYSGIQQITISEKGELVLTTEAGRFTENIPEAYQVIAGKKVLVKVSYIIVNGSEVKFRVNEYNRDYELVIDPQLIYCSYLGGSGNDQIFYGKVVTDSQGNIYFTSRTTSLNFPVTAGSFDNVYNGLYDIVVVKLNPTATQIIFSTYIGGADDDFPYDIEFAGPTNDLVIGGYTRGSNFPTTSGVYQPNYGGFTCDGFVLKLNNMGNTLLFSTYLGADLEDYVHDIEIDGSGNIYAGGYSSSNFPTTPSVYQSTNANPGFYDIFISKLNPTATSLISSTLIGGSTHDRGSDIELDNLGNVFILGSAEGTFPVTPGAFDVTYNGGIRDVIVCKFNPTFSNLLYSTYIGGPDDDLPSVGGLKIDNMNQPTLTGRCGTGFPTTAGSYCQTFSGGTYDAFLTKLNTTFNSLIYSTLIGGAGNDIGFSLCFEENGNPIIAGAASGGFPTTVCTYDGTYNGGTNDAFISKFNNDASSLLYSTFFGGSGDDKGIGITCLNDTAILIGETTSPNLPTTADAYDLSFNGGGYDDFIAKIILSCESSIADFIIPDTACIDEDITIQNISTGGTTYYWNFCSTNLADDPLGVNIGNLGNLERPVYSSIAKDGNNYFVFITNYLNGTLTRLAFGNSLTNTPVATNMGSVGGVLLPNIEGIQIKKDQVSGNWYGQIAGGPNNVLFTLNFGNSLNNIPVATNSGNLGNQLSYPHTIYTFQEGNNWHSFIGNYSSNTLIRLDYGNSLANTPTVSSIGNIGSLDGPVGFYPIIDNGTWYLFVTSQNNSTLSRLNFGNSLLNTPTGVNLGNINGTLNDPRSITIIRDCDEVYGFVVNRITNDIVRLTYPNGLSSTPTGFSLGNIANFSFPHHISELFRVGDSLFAFIMNVNSSTISRICFPSCNNSSLPSSNLQNPPAFSYSTPGAYNVSLVVDEGLPSQSNICKNIAVIAPPVAAITGSTSICVGGTLTLSSNSAPGYTYLWTGPNGFTSTNQTVNIPNVTAANAGIYTLIISYGGCPSEPVNTTVTVTTTTTAIAGPDAITCDSNPYSLVGASATNYSSVTWSTSGTGTFSNTAALNPVYTPSLADVASGSVILTLTASSPPCTDVADQLTLSFSHLSLANAGPDNSTCQSQPFTISGATATNAPSLSWVSNGSGTLSNSATLNPAYTPGSGETGVITLTLTTNSALPCPVDTDAMLLTINPSPVAVAGNDATICEGTDYTISGASAINNLSFSWSENGTGSLINTSTLSPSYIPGPGETGNISITLSATGNPPCSLVSDAMILTINPLPILVSGPPITICAGSVVLLAANSVQNYSSVLWTHNGPGTLSSATSLATLYTPGINETGIVTFTLTVYGIVPCNPVQGQTTLTIVPAVFASAGINDTICRGETFTVSSANVTNATSFSWTSSGSGNLSNNTTITPTYTPGNGETGPVTLILTAQGSIPCPDVTDAMQLFVQDYPTAFAGSNASICQNSLYTITNASASNYSSFTWSHNGAGNLTETHTLSPTYHPGINEAGIVEITLTSNGLSSCLPASHSMNLTIDPLPVADAGPDEASCQGFVHSVTGANALNQNSVQWIENGAGTLGNSNTLTPAYTPTSDETGTVLLILKVAGSYACSLDTASDSKILIINPLPEVDARNDQSFCASDSYTLSGLQSDCSSYLWTTSGDGNFSNSAVLNSTYTPGPIDKSSGSVFLTLTGQGTAQCSSQTDIDQVILTIDPMPTVYAGIDDAFCVENPIILSGASISNSNSVHWSAGDGIFSDPNLISPDYMPGNIDFTNGYVNLTLTANGLLTCSVKSVSDTRIFSITPYPDVFAGTDDYICSDQTLYLLSANAEHINISTIQWTFIGGDGHFDNPNLLNPIYYPGPVDLTTINRQIIFTLTANGFDNCAATVVSDQVQLLIDPIPIPDAGPDGSVCGRNPYTLYSDSAVYQQDITWSSTGDGIFINNSILHPVYIPGPTDQGKTVVLSMHLLGCKGLISDDSMWLTVHPDPSATITGSTAICEGTSSNISITFTGTPPWSVIYSDGTTPVSVNNINSSPYIFSVNPVVTTAWHITAANDAFCNVPADSINGLAAISVNPLPDLFRITSSNYGFYCEGDSGVLIGLNNSQPGMNYSLFRNGLPAGVTLLGTGFPLVFGLFTTPGQYSVQGQNPSGNCLLMMRDTINVVMNPTPVTDFTTNSACSNDTTYFTISGNYIQKISSWHWTFGDGTFAIYNAPFSPSHVYPTYGIYTVVLSVVDTNGCQYTVTHPVEVLPHPTAFFSTSTPNCLGNLTQLTDLSTNPAGQGYLNQWIWTFGDGSPADTIDFPDSPNVTHQYAAQGNYNVTLTVNNSKGCSSMYQMVVSVSNRPMADFTSWSSCEDQAAVFQDNSSENLGGQITSWLWNFGEPTSGALNVSTLKDPTHIYSTPGLFDVTLIVTNLNGCSDTLQKQITIKAAPVSNFFNSPGCLNSPTQFLADSTIINIPATATYLWDFGDGNTAFSRNALHNYLAPGTYTVTLTITDTAGCVGDTSLPVTINPPPVAHFNANTDNCQGQAVAFTDQSSTSTGFINTWEWDFGDGNVQTVVFPNAPNVNHTYAGAGTFSVTLTVTNNEGCIHSESRIVNMLGAPTSDFMMNGQCMGTAVQFTDLTTVSGTQVLSNWNWNFGDPTSGTGNTSTLQNPAHNFATAGTYVVELITFTGNNCSDTITKSITIKQKPAVDFNTQSACADNPAAFTPTGMAVATIASWNWSFGDGGTSTLQAPTHTYTSPGTYSVTLTVTDTAGCSNTRTKPIIIAPIPDANFGYTAPTCQGDVVSYTDMSSTTSGFIAKWIWDFGDGNTQTITFPASPDVNHAYTNAGTFNVKLIVKTNDSCTNELTRVVTVLPKPTAAFMHGPACLGNQVNFNDFSISNTTGTISGWAWNFGDPTSGTANNSALQNPTHTYNTAGTYSVALVVSIPGGCSDTITQQITVSPPPSVDFTPVAGCNGDTTEFTSTVNLATTQGFYWQFGDGGTAFTANPIHIYATAGTYTVTLTITDTAGCTNVKVKPVTVIQGPLAVFSSSTPSCSGQPITFTDLSTANGGSIGNWYWTFGDGTDTTYSSSVTSFNHTYTQPGTFQVTLHVTTALGCEHTVQNTVTISPSPIAGFEYANTCQGQSTQFTDMTSLNGGSSLTQRTWDFGDPASGILNTSTLVNPVHNFANPGQYVVTLVTLNAGGCADTLEQTLTISPKPGVDFYNDSLVCFGDLTTLFTDTLLTNTDIITYYEWDFGDGSPHAFTQNASHEYSVAGTFNVTLTIQDTAGCTNAITRPLTIHTAPTSMFNYSGICENAPTQFTDLSLPPQGETIAGWYWEFLNGAVVLGTDTVQNPEFTFPLPGTYSVKLTTFTENGCDNTKLLPVQIWNKPTAYFKYTASPCANGLVTFQDSSWSYQGQVNSWQWEFEPYQFGTGTNPSHSYYAVDSCYDVKLMIEDLRGCMDTVIQPICVPAELTVDFNTTLTCFGEAVTFTPELLTPEPPADSLVEFTWNFGDPVTGSNNVSTLKTPEHTFSSVGFFTVNFSAKDKFGCMAYSYKTVQVNALPVANFSYTTGQCDSTLIFSSTSVDTSSTINTYIWHYGDGTSDTLSSSTSTHKYASPGEYITTLTVINDNGCTDTYTDTVTRSACIVAAAISTESLLCQNYSLTFADISTCDGTITQWNWNFGDGTPALNYGTYQPTVTHTFLNPGPYTISLKVSTQVGTSTISDSTTLQIVVKPTPLAGFSVDPVCLGVNAEFNDTTQANGATALFYRWEFGDEGFSDTSNLKNPDYLYSVPGTYHPELIVKNQFGCQDTATADLTVNGLPDAGYSNSLACSGQETYFFDASQPYIAPIAEWGWRVNDSLGMVGSMQGNTPAFTFDSTGRYQVMLTVADSIGCADTIIQQVTVNPSPASAFSYTENVENIQGQVQFTNGSVGAEQYFWDFGNGETAYSESPIITYAEDGTYEVILVSVSENGCHDTASITYEMIFKGLWVPNAFAPGGTIQATRFWKPVGVNLASYNVEVYNSYGALLWKSSKLDEKGAPADGWDGTYNEKLCQQDVYVWKIQAIFRDGSVWYNLDVGEHEGLSEPVYGTITLIR
jgi:PKD repeat protein